MNFSSEKKNCYSCIYTKDPMFGGVCPKAGEIGGSFCEQEHSDCWESPDGSTFPKPEKKHDCLNCSWTAEITGEEAGCDGAEKHGKCWKAVFQKRMKSIA